MLFLACLSRAKELPEPLCHIHLLSDIALPHEVSHKNLSIKTSSEIISVAMLFFFFFLNESQQL